MPLTNSPYTLLPGKKLSSPTEAMFYGHGWKINLLTGEKSHFDSSTLFDVLNYKRKNRILHLSYEAGYLNNEGSHNLNEEMWLALDLHYDKVEEFEAKGDEVELTCIQSPSKEEYFKAFDKGYAHLERGDSYQFNLTFPFRFKFQGDLFQSLMGHSQKGEYAHVTVVPSLHWAIVSNSPECLFNQKGNRIETKPIKGTIANGDGAWEELTQSKKDQAELYMITDLLRNDLNRIEPKAKVEKLKARLNVPGLIHQYSHISLETSEAVALKKVSKALFPGGSVTGAPKIRTMEILSELESTPRGAYCGSTFVFDEDEIKVSINIRTAEVDTNLNEFIYGAGGGITLLSDKEEEYREMLAKVDSFALLLQSSSWKNLSNFDSL